MSAENHRNERTTSAETGSHGLSAVQKMFPIRRPEKHMPGPSQNEVTPERTRLGLTELYSPVNAPVVDFIFVHGLRGGSIKTWRKYEDPSYFWPKEWIPFDSDLAAVRTSSFGYPSDWLTFKESILNLHDFGHKLLGEIQTSPFLRKSGTTPIVFIAHSMGGLVVKKAYLLALREAPELAARIKSIVFLATPHRGSDSVDLLHSILELAGSEKTYVGEISRNSVSLQVINDEFRHVVGSLDLWSFFEGRKTRTGFKQEILVTRDSAILGYKHEQISFLDADHRAMCKFESPEDENYITLRNVLATIVERLVQDEDSTAAGLEAIRSYLNIGHSPETDLEELEGLKTTGTCEWIERSDKLQSWLNHGGTKDLEGHSQPRNSASNPSQGVCRVYWLTAKPGAGKTICSAHVIRHLRDYGYNCSYFFFQEGIKSNQSLGSMLRSIAFQMAQKHQSIRELIRRVEANGGSIDKDSDDVIWRRLYSLGILKEELNQTHIWVLDGLDQCPTGEKFLHLLNKMACAFPLRIYISSRPQPELERAFNRLPSSIVVIPDSIKHEDTQGDMQLYLSSDEADLDMDPRERLELERKLLERSNGCFLWLKLVLYELERSYLQDSFDSVLDEIPTEMHALYERSLLAIAQNHREKRLTQALFTWAVCACRPLSLAELQVALQLDSNLQVRDLRRSIDGLCGNLLYVDRNDCVQLIHSSLRDFIFDTSLESDYAVRRQSGHERLAKVCLKYMEQEMRPPRSRSFGSSLVVKRQNRAVFSNYAATTFSEHIVASSSSSDSLPVSICNFLKASVLAWIEYIASEEPNLYCLTGAAKNFKRYLERRAKYVPPIGEDFKMIHDWTIDLVRLVAKFGQNLKNQPSSILLLIPVIAPQDSQLHRLSLNSPDWLHISGSANTTWDDCVSFIEYRETYATALACGRSAIAIGMKNGIVILYDQATCQEKLRVTHQIPHNTKQKQSPTIRLLAFDTVSEYFASAGLQSVCLWSTDGQLVQMFELDEPLVNVTFSLDQSSVLIVTRSSKISTLTFVQGETQGSLVPPPYLERRRSSGYNGPQSLKLPKQAPLAAAISPDQSVAALLYRGKDIYLYNLGDEQLLGTCGRDSGLTGPNISVLTALFHPNGESGLLAVVYQDGDLALYDYWAQKELVTVYGDAYSLAATPDGQTLASGNTSGTIRLWDFETLTLLYIIRSGIEEVRSLAFTGDGSRLVDRRDTRVKIWEPSALIRGSIEENTSQSDGATIAPPEVGVNDESLTTTAMCADERGHYIFAGRSDGSVVAFDMRNANEPVATIHNFRNDTFAEMMIFANDRLAVVNSTQMVQVWNAPTSFGASANVRLLVEKVFTEPIQQLLLSQDGHQLLVNTAAFSEIMHLEIGDTNIVSHALSDSVGDRRWAAMFDNIACIDSGGSMKLYDWKSGRELQATALTPTSDSASSRTWSAVETFVPTQSGHHIVAAMSTSYSTLSRLQLTTWINPFGPLATGSAPTMSTNLSPATGRQLLNVHTFLGVYEERILFLDHDMWICSLKPFETSGNASDPIVKHIFIPPDFIGGSTVAKPFVTNQGHFIFCKEDKLAIIKGALDWSFT